MEKLSVWQWAIAHWGQLIAIIVAILSLLGTIKNLLTYPKAQKVISVVMDILSFIAEHGKSGLVGPVSFPGVPSRKNGVNTSPPASLLLLALLACTVSGCGAVAKKIGYDISACALGQVPAAIADIVQQAEASIIGAPGSISWAVFASSDLVKHGVDAAICIVEAVLHDLDGKLPPQTQTIATVEERPPKDSVLFGAHARGVDWLRAHGVNHRHMAHAR
jgi:hypothetical protein